MAMGLVLCMKGDIRMCNIWKSRSRRRRFCDARICGGGEGKYVNLSLPQGPASAVLRGWYVDSAGLMKESERLVVGRM
jgi:hypothetical protein